MFAVLVKVSLWQEFICVVAEYIPVVATMPDVGHAYGAFRNVHAVVPVFFGSSMRHPELCEGAPKKDFSDGCLHVWKMGGVGKCQETVAANDGVYFRLCSMLHFWEGYHSQHPPQKAGSGCLRTCGTEIRRIMSCACGIKTDHDLLQYADDERNLRLAKRIAVRIL